MIARVEYLAGESATPVALVVVPIVILLSVVAWGRSRFRPAVGLLELVRLLIVSVVLFALYQPELVEIDQTNRLPRVAVLWDDSLSMQTPDAGATTGAASSTRAAWVERAVDAQGLSQRLEGRFEVTGAAFSSADTEPIGAGVEEDASRGGRAGTDMAAPMAHLLEDRALRAVLLYGDGDWNAGGNPAEVAMRYRMRDVPIFTVTVGSRIALPDLEFVSFDPPAFAPIGHPLAIPYAIRNAMSRDVRVAVTLDDSTGHEVSEEVLLLARSTFEGTLRITPRSLGNLTLRAEVPVQENELDADNNVASAVVDVRQESLRVLLVESYPRWEYRYLRNAMVRDPGVDVDCYLFHPDLKGVGGGPHYLDGFPTREELSKYDVVFLGDVGLGADQLGPRECEDLRGLVAEQASGLILMPGLGGKQLTLAGSELDPLFPVDLALDVPHGYGSRVAARLRLTKEGRQSSLTKLAPDEDANARLWEELPGFQWHAAVLRARAGSTVLAVHSSRDQGTGRMPLLVTKSFGTGKVLFMGTDAAWRWREGLEDKVHYRFWSQVVRWMAYQRRMNAGETMRFYYTPDRPDVQRVTTLYANVMDEAGAPRSGANLAARIVAPSGRVTRTRFETHEGEWGLYRATFSPSEVGEHEIVLSCQETQERLVARMDVVGTAPERVGLPARHDVMEELARISRGRAIPGGDSARIEASLRGLGVRPEVIRRTRIWSHPALGAVMVVLMGCFWLGRKAVGRF